MRRKIFESALGFDTMVNDGAQHFIKYRNIAVDQPRSGSKDHCLVHSRWRRLSG
ncbi:hypothetical protein [Variovorax sp. GT1P44]|uniref:hypothetical protein n=1 Tax=Variovorax sp. GT1P44 TaxID=3443742 RepID=UPI003F48BF4F